MPQVVVVSHLESSSSKMKNNNLYSTSASENRSPGHPVSDQSCDQFGHRDKFLFFSAKDGRIFFMVSDSIGDKTGNRLRMKGGDHKEYPAIKTAKLHSEPGNIETFYPFTRNQRKQAQKDAIKSGKYLFRAISNMEIAFILVFGASYCASFSMGLGLGEECTLGGQTCTLNSSECAPSQFEPDRNVCQCKDGYLVDNETKEGGECSNDSDCVVHALCQEEGGRYFCRCNEEDNIVFNPEDGYCRSPSVLPQQGGPQRSSTSDALLLLKGLAYKLF
ncbi:unnamed protein product [Darwinula stevensoni]|uniref:Uncharacterized protein n=1 Tax=Darwinula stevensoni TaxID=69355 RepID=A0A7R9A4K5_9CRUS|nr:unnamed protein product [Darwinula stevensoni]CAG0883578.1 unnamed protein product [Darwinula stevensoni]